MRSTRVVGKCKLIWDQGHAQIDAAGVRFSFMKAILIESGIQCHTVLKN